MPTTNMSRAPGRHIPKMPAIEPIAPRNFSPTSTAMLVAFKPGRLWLMESISTNSLSSTQWRLVTRLSRRYGTTPPKLVAPMMRNSRKIWKTETAAGAAVAPAVVCSAGFPPGSLMALRLISVEAVHHCCLRNAQCQPVLHVLLQGNVELRGQLLLLVADAFSLIELHLEGELAHQRLMFAAGAPQPDVTLADQPFAEVQLTKLSFSSVAFCNLASAGNTFIRVAIEALSASCIWLSPNWQLCEYRMRYPPTSSFRGRASALNLMRYLPAIFGRTSSAVACFSSGWRNLNTISGSPTGKPST